MCSSNTKNQKNFFVRIIQYPVKSYEKKKEKNLKTKNIPLNVEIYDRVSYSYFNDQNKNLT